MHGFDHPQFVRNAGLVLLAPYLPALFERSGAAGRDAAGRLRIEGAAAQACAAGLLRYLVDGRADATEAASILDRLLVGAAVDQSLRPAIATPDQREACDGLLTAVVARWQVLGATSPAGLRETFLQREGRLQPGEDRWTLTIQRKTVDVLLDRIPWSFSAILHPWMTGPLFVTW